MNESKQGYDYSEEYYKTKPEKRVLFRDITGQRFGKLRIVKRLTDGNDNPINHVPVAGGVPPKMPRKPTAFWICACDCGNHCIKSGYNLLYAGTRSCGCLISEARRKQESIK